MSSLKAPETTLDEQKNESEDREYQKKLASERKVIVKLLNEQAYEVQNAIARKLQMRFTPKVTFFYDEGFENALKVESILGKLGQKNAKKPASEESSDDE